MKKQVLALLTTAVMIITAACGSTPGAESTVNSAQPQDAPAAEGQEVYTLKISTSQTDQSLITLSYMELAERVKENSGGRLVIEVFPSSQLGNDEDVIEQAIQGVGVAVNTDAARMGTYVQEMGILMMGYFADDYDECRKVTETEIFSGWETELAEKHGIRVLAFNFYDGPRHFMTNKEVWEPSDLKGLRIRTIGAEVCTETIGALGATPVAMAWGEVYNGVQSKALDGCEAQNTSTYPSKMYEVAKYQIKTGHFQLLQGLVCGEIWFESLPEDLQEILLTTAREVGVQSAAAVLEEAESCEQKMKDAGLVVLEPDLEAFKAAVEPVYEKLGYAGLRERIYQEIGKAD